MSSDPNTPLEAGWWKAYKIPTPESDTRTTVNFPTCKYVTVDTSVHQAVPQASVSVLATTTVPKEGYCLTKFEVKVQEGGEDPRLRVTRIVIEVHFPNPNDARLHLAVPKGQHYVGMPDKKALEKSYSATAGVAPLAGLLTASLGYQLKSTQESLKGIVINDSQLPDSVIWTVLDYTGKGIHTNIPIDIVIQHQPGIGFDARLVIKVRFRVYKARLAWETLNDIHEFKIKTDGQRDVGALDDRILPLFGSLLQAGPTAQPFLAVGA